MKKRIEVLRTPAATVKSRLDKHIEKLFHTNRQGQAKPCVCLICDRFTGTKHEWLSVFRLKKNMKLFAINRDVHGNIPESLRASYQYSGLGAKPWMKSCMFSRRGNFCTQQRAFLLCKECYACFENKDRYPPPGAICNGWFFGEPPTELTSLTDIELLLITPVRGYNYVYSGFGGVNRQIKGTLGFFKVEHEGISRIATICKSLADVLDKDIIYVMHGQMTNEQKNVIKQKFKIRPAKVMDAIQWLIANNINWNHVDLNDFEATLQSRLPRLYDLTSPVSTDAADDNNEERDHELESTESFNVFFPDGTMNRLSFGQQSGEEFVRLVNSAREQGMKAEVVADLSKEFTHDMVNDIFGQSCLLQMPYGRGGLKECRTKTNGDTNKLSLTKFVEHCSYVSSPYFHEPIFVLKMYNLKIRDAILAKTNQSVRGSTTMQNLRENIDHIDFKSAAQKMNSGAASIAGNATTRQFLKSIKTCSKAIPHSDEAAKNPRAWIDSLGHAFGQAGIFLTVTPDDENTFLVTCYSGNDSDGEPIDLSTMNFDERKASARERQRIRLKFPGITALNFQYVLEVIIKYVIGWDTETRSPTNELGLFGVPLGYALAVEEQARNSLHCHIIVYLQGYNTFLENVSKPGVNRKAVDASTSEIIQLIDDTVSTKIVDFKSIKDRNRKRTAVQAFEHDNCNAPGNFECTPVLVSHQRLRNLRHQKCHKVSTAMMVCPNCEKEFSSEEIVQQYLEKVKKVPVPRIPDDTGTLTHLTYGYTKPLCLRNDIEASVCAAKSDLHATKHAKSCFKGTDKRHGGLYKNECRFHKPALPASRTHLVPVILQGDGSVAYFLWTGTEERRTYYNVVPKRNEHDCFANEYVPAISHSKIGGNTNARLVTPGPIGNYTTKYPMKGEQKDIQEPYTAVTVCLEKAMNKERKHPTDFAESLRLTAMGAFSHNSTNVVSGPQAAFLLRHGKRFFFSHAFAYLPLLDLKKYVTEGTINYARVRQHKGKAYSDISALHYICRPSELEDVPPKDFYECWEASDPSMRKNGQQEFEFQDQPDMSHPSSFTNEKTGDEYKVQKCRERSQKHLAWLYTRPFHDAAEFQGNNILECDLITDKMEEQALLILLLCYHYRTKEDLELEGSYVKKLRQVYKQGSLKKYLFFLQNIQNERGNFLRVRPNCDELQRETERFEDEDGNPIDVDSDEDDDVGIDDVQGDDLEELWNSLQDVENLVDGSSEDTSGLADKFDPDYIMADFDLNFMIDKGPRKCGRNGIANVAVESSVDGVYCHSETGNVPATETADEDTIPEEATNPSKTTLINVFMSNRTFEGNSHELAIQDTPVVLVKATGTAASIVMWAKQSNLDLDQSRAFEIFTAAFVLEFVRGSESTSETINATGRVFFNKEKLKLLKLAGLVSLDATNNAFNSFGASEKVVAFLHGHGGSGKSAVIELLVEYCKEFCDEVGEVWTDRTIVVSAFTGVAATLINGRTAHMAFHLSKKEENIPQLEFDAWTHTKLVIIDEISFASRAQIQKVEQRLRRLKGRALEKYGGLNVVFCGDLRQLEPIDTSHDGEGSGRIYSMDFREWHGYINTYVELNGMHRFRNDVKFGELLVRWRNAVLTKRDLVTLNSRVFTGTNSMPPDLRYATYRNKEKSSINCALFQKAYSNDTVDSNNICNNCIMIFCSDLERSTGHRTYKQLDNQWERYIWQNFSEGDCLPVEHAGRFDPLLCLYQGRPVMVTKNADVENGIANGTRGLFRKVVLKAGVQPSLVKMSCGRFVRAVRVSHTEKIIIAMENDTSKHIDLIPDVKKGFMLELDLPASLVASNHKKQRQKVRLLGSQYPLVCNNATTGHKLQGASVDTIFVNSTTRVANWNYVVASRVRTLNGLYARDELTEEDLHHLNNFPEKLQQMIDQFRTHKRKKPLNREDYEYIFERQELQEMRSQITSS